MLESYVTGLVVCGGIIVAIGAQNAYLLGQAVRREHHWWVAGICMSSDAILFTAGTFGLSAALLAYPQALDVFRWLGVAFLVWLALQASWRVVKGRASLRASEESAAASLRTVLLTTLAVTLLNPQVYLDTLLLIPAIGAQQSDRITFVMGASSASVLWFGLLAWGGAALAPMLARPMAWRVIDGAIAAMMAVIAFHLASNGIELPAT